MDSHSDRANGLPALRDSDAMWLRRGQYIGQALADSRKTAVAWAGIFALVGGGLVLLALLAPSEIPIVTADPG